jgi:hypothetical protein
MFDVAMLDTAARSEEGVNFVVRNPTTGAQISDKEGKPVTIRLMGSNSEKYRGVQRAIQANVARLAGRDIKQTEEERRGDMEKLMCAVTVGWSFTELDGKPFPFTSENAKTLWGDKRWTWLLQMAFVFVNSEGNFLALSAAD